MRQVRKNQHGCAGILACSLLLSVHACFSQEQIEPEASQQNSLFALAQDVRYGSDRERADFVRTALREMALDYEREAGNLRRYYVDHPEIEHDDGRWIHSTEGYAYYLLSLADRIGADTLVDIYPQPQGTVMLRIDGAPVMISSLRANGGDALDKAIVESYCVLWPCEGSARVASPERQEAPPVAPQGTWSFSASRGPIFETDDGLQFVFEDTESLGWKKQTCMQVVQEIRLLVQSLRDLRQRGIVFDWDQLRLQQMGIGFPHRVIVNRQGAYAALRLPGLQGSPELLRLALPWVRARVEGREHRQAFPRAERLLAGVSPFR